jgi:polyhydroxyalkanoate synthesis regulator protein
MRYHTVMATMIRRYANRKLYDVARSRYVTTDELADRIRLGEQIVVSDHQTDADVTVTVLSAVLRRSDLSAALLHQMIRYGSSHVEHMLDQARRGLSGLQHDMRDLELEEMERKMDELEALITELVGQADEHET